MQSFVGRSLLSLAIRRRSVVAWSVLAMVATMLAAVPTTPVAAQDERLPQGFGSDGRMHIPFVAEPEYLLVAGDERWQVKNRPQGTMLAGYGAPANADDAAMSVSARLPNLGTPAGKQVIDITHVRGDGPTVALRNDYAFAVYDDGTAEVWGPKNVRLGAESRVVLTPPTGTRIVGGWVVADVFGPEAMVILSDGRIVYYEEHGQGNLVHRPDRDERIVAEGQEVVGATVRESSAMNSPTAKMQVLQPDSQAAMAVVTKDTVFVFSMRRESHAAVINRGNGLSFPAGLSDEVLQKGPVQVDLDYSCLDVSGGIPPRAAGNVAGSLGCPSSGAGMVMGQVAVGFSFGVTGAGQAARSVAFLGLHDELEQADVDPNRPWRTKEVGSTYSCDTDATHPGAFDVRTGVGRMAMGCVGTNYVADGQGAHTTGPDHFAMLIHQTEWRVGVDRAGVHPGGREAFTVDPEATWIDRFAKPDPRRGTFLAPTRPVDWTGVSQPTMQLQLTCEDIVGRTLPNRSTVLNRCRPTSSASYTTAPGGVGRPPSSNLTAAIAGYGTSSETSETALFVTHLPADVHFHSRAQADGLDIAEHQWTASPNRLFAHEIEDARADLANFDPSSLTLYSPPANPPTPLLSHVPRSTHDVITLRIDDRTPRVETVATAPIALLQAPPIVGGLGQQTDFTSEFGTTTTQGSGTSESNTTRFGTHISNRFMMLIGTGIFGNDLKGGAGVEAGFSFMNEVEHTFDKSIEHSTTESYGGSFDDHTVVTRSVLMDTWRAVVESDPSGLSTNTIVDFQQPTGQTVVQSVPLSTLEEESPDLYGPNGVYRPSLNMIVGDVVIGDPGTYPPGASELEPSTLLVDNGGPCIGGYVPPGDPTPDNFGTPRIGGDTNPFLEGQIDFEGSSILVSDDHFVSNGNSLTEGATIEISESETRSAVASNSFDFSASAIVALETEISFGIAFEISNEFAVGIDAGWSHGTGVSQTLGEGLSLNATIGNIESSELWAQEEQYRWRMYMCEIPLGSLATNQTVWVQGYLVDDYMGSGGLTDLGPTTTVWPMNSTVVPVDPAGAATGTVVDCTTVPFDEGVPLRWANDRGTVEQYRVEVEDISGGGLTSYAAPNWDWSYQPATEEGPATGGPEAFHAAVRRSPDDQRSNVRPRPTCAGFDPGEFEDGHLYRWRAVVEGFVNNDQLSEWEFFRPQVVPSATTFTVRRPVVHDDGSVSIDIEDAPGVRSLRYDVDIYPAGEETPGSEVAQRDGVRDRYRTPELPPGSYVATVVGHNDHVDSNNSPVLTDVQRVEFTVEETLQAQFQWSHCEAGPCPTGTDVTFTDQTQPADGFRIVEWRWDFGDGTTSTRQNPVHRFETAPATGTYPVRLIVTDELGRVSVLTQDVAVGNRAPELAPNLADDDQIPVDTPVELRAGAVDPDGDDADLTIDWDLGDGTTATGQTVSHTWTAQGPMTVTLTATDALGQATVQQIPIEIVGADQPLPPNVDDQPGGSPGSGTPVTPDDGGEQADGVPVTANDDDDPVTVTIDTPLGPVTITFAGVRTDGVVNVTTQSNTPPGLDPNVLPLGDWFDIVLDGVAFDTATVCVPYDLASLGVPQGSLRLFHIDGGTEDVTTTVGDDEICGETDDFSPFVIGVAKVDRVAGADRWATAAAASARTFEPGVDAVYVATGHGFADALAAAPKAAMDGAPVLLTAPDALPEATAAEIQRLAPARIVVLGGTAAVSAEVEAALAQLAPVERIAGASRFDTAAQLATRGRTGPVGTVLLATGEAFADALSAGPAAAALDGPVLLTGRDAVPEATLDALTVLDPDRVVVLGGQAAVSDDVLDQIGAAGWTAERLAGPDRFTTSALTSADAFPAGAGVVHLATAADYPDALAGGAVAGALGGPVLLVGHDAVPEVTLGELDRLDPDRLVVLGGSAAVSDAVMDLLRARMAG